MRARCVGSSARRTHRLRAKPRSRRSVCSPCASMSLASVSTVCASRPSATSSVRLVRSVRAPRVACCSLVSLALESLCVEPTVELDLLLRMHHLARELGDADTPAAIERALIAERLAAHSRSEHSLRHVSLEQKLYRRLSWALDNRDWHSLREAIEQSLDAKYATHALLLTALFVLLALFSS